MPRVYVPQLPTAYRDGKYRLSYSMEPAKKFGDLVVILQLSDIEQLRMGGEDVVYARICDVMHDFKEEDYLLMVGDFAAISMAFYEAASNVGLVNCLQWDRLRSRYNVLRIDVEDGLTKGELYHDDVGDDH